MAGVSTKFNSKIRLFPHADEHELRYLIQVDDNVVETMVTKSPIGVENWIKETERLNHRRLHRLIVIVTLHLRPTATAGDDKSVAVLQLHVHSACLIYQIHKAKIIPDALKTFLSNPNYTFVGIGVDSNKAKLFSEYSLNLKNTMDLGAKANYELNKPDLLGFDSQMLTLWFLRKQVDPEKLEAALRLSDWDSDQLSHDQVLYATVISYGSFVVARMLESWYD